MSAGAPSWSERAADVDPAVRRSVAREQSAPADLLTRLAADPDASVRAAVAEHPATPVDVLVTLAGDPSADVRRGVARNPGAPPELLARLAGDPDSHVRGRVARNAGTPADALSRLADDPATDVRWYLAQNPATPPEALARLAAGPAPDVRRQVARHPATTAEILIRLADEPGYGIGEVIARHPAAPAELRDRIAVDARAAEEREREYRGTFGSGVGFGGGDTRIGVASPPAAEAAGPPPVAAEFSGPAPAGSWSAPPIATALPAPVPTRAILEHAPRGVREAYRSRQDDAPRAERTYTTAGASAPASRGSWADGSRPSFTTYRVWFATNRRLADGPRSREGDQSFGRESADATSYGHCDVEIPHDRALGSLGSAWWKRLVRRVDDRLSVGTMQHLGEEVYWAALARTLGALPRAQARATVFLHGYNVGFTAAALRAAQLGHDLQVPGPICFFSWPSRGGLFGYAADVAAIEASEPAIARYLARLATDTGAERVDVIAHSMGNRGLLRALDRITADAAGAARCRFGHFVLAAPDVDRRTFLNLAAAYRCAQARTTLYVSARDRALGVSAWLHAFGRAGFAPPVTVADGIDTVHVENADRSLLAHGYFGSIRTVLTDMHDVLEFDAPPERRVGLRSAVTPGGERFWRIAP
jgi:esterase/lipase superfamily enzyme